MKQIRELLEEHFNLCVIVEDCSKKDKKKFQEFLFKNGFGWCGTNKEVKNLHVKSYFISKKGTLTFLNRDPIPWCERHGYSYMTIEEFCEMTDFNLVETVISKNYDI